VIKQTTKKSVPPISTNMGDAGCWWAERRVERAGFLVTLRERWKIKMNT